MAISARQASLLAQRQLYSDRRKVLSPANNAIASIAKKTATDELNVMVSKYNQGLISNDEMKAFLVKTSQNSSLSANDRLDVENQIKDFDSRITKDKLEAIFKAAPENTLEQYQAVQALSNYYKTRASQMVDGTPAQSDVLTTAAQYDQKATDIQRSIQVQARQNQRYIAEQKINQIPNSTSERSIARASMFKDLYDQALSDGDTTSANKYASQYQQELTNAQQQAQNESESVTREEINAEKKTLRDYLGMLTNEYHDGRINEQQYLQALAEISPRIDATNDYGLINTLNRTTDIIQKNLQKGGLNRGTTALGLPTVLGKGKGSGTGGVVTDWDQKDFDYSDGLRMAQEAFQKGDLTPQEYIDYLKVKVAKRADDLQNQIGVMEEVARENPNAKVMFNGKKTRVADVVESLYSEQEKLDVQAGAVLSGNPKNLALVQIAPSEVNKSGNVTKTGKGFATFELVDRANLPEDQYVIDSEGVYHQILKRQINLTAEQMAESFNGTFTDNNGKQHFIKTDSSGNPYIEVGQYVKAYRPGSSQSIELDVKPGQQIKSFRHMEGDELVAAGKYNMELKAKQQAEKKQTGVVDANNKPLNFTGIPQKPVDIQKATQSGGLVTQPIATPTPDQPKVVSPKVPEFKSSDELNLPKNPVSIALPQERQVVSSSSPVTLPRTVQQPKLQNVGLPSQVNQNLVKTVNPTGKTPIKIQGTQGLPVIPKPQDGVLAKVVKGIGTKIKGLFR